MPTWGRGNMRVFWNHLENFRDIFISEICHVCHIIGYVCDDFPSRLQFARMFGISRAFEKEFPCGIGRGCVLQIQSEMIEMANICSCVSLFPKKHLCIIVYRPSSLQEWPIYGFVGKFGGSKFDGWWSCFCSDSKCHFGICPIIWW